jgi:hypothetical protein
LALSTGGLSGIGLNIPWAFLSKAASSAIAQPASRIAIPTAFNITHLLRRFLHDAGRTYANLSRNRSQTRHIRVWTSNCCYAVDVVAECKEAKRMIRLMLASVFLLTAFAASAQQQTSSPAEEQTPVQPGEQATQRAEEQRTPPAAEQTRQRADEQTRQRADEAELPIPISSPAAVRPGTVEPLTPEQKVGRAIRNVISPQAVANRAVTAGWNHLWRDPEEWGGNMDAYGKRFASRMGRLAVRQGVQLATDVAFGIEPRYDRCNCTSFWGRTGHAWRRVVIARRDNGGEIFAVTNFAGAYIPPLITDQWYPASKNTWSHKWQSGTEFLAWRGVTNMVREFWPDIARKLKLSRFARGD